jgi:DNA-binding transcriptional MerR regulator
MSDEDAHFGISEASERTGLPDSTIRFYDREFSDFLSIERGSNNERKFDEEDLRDLEYIRYLIKREDMSVEEVADRLRREQSFKQRKESAEDSEAPDEQSQVGEEALDQFRETLQGLREEIQQLESAIRNQDERIETIAEDQENILKLLDMNLQRYNELVEELPR